MWQDDHNVPVEFKDPVFHRFSPTFLYIGNLKRWCIENNIPFAWGKINGLLVGITLEREDMAIAKLKFGL